MADVLLVFAGLVLLAVAASLSRIRHGPTPADRMMGAQIAGTGGIAVVLLVGFAGDVDGAGPAALDVALVLALLAAFASVGFVKAASADGAGDPEEEDGRLGDDPLDDPVEDVSPR